MREFGGGKGREKFCNYIIMSKLNNLKYYYTKLFILTVQVFWCKYIFFIVKFIYHKIIHYNGFKYSKS